MLTWCMTVSLLTWASRASERLLADHRSSRLIVDVKVASRMSENWQSLLNKVPRDMHTSHTKCRSLFQDDWGIANDVGITNYNGKDFPKNIWRGEGLIWLYCWLSTKDWLIEIEKCVLIPEASWFLELKIPMVLWKGLLLTETFSILCLTCHWRRQLQSAHT